MPLRTGSPLPALDGATEWLNGEPNLETLRGAPVLVHFWSVGCHICHENAPKLDAWRQEFVPRGLQMVSFHMPRNESELEVAAVKANLADMHITEPCGVDNEHGAADAFQNQFVPAYFLFDREGNLRSRTAGDAGLTNMENTLRRMFEPAA